MGHDRTATMPDYRYETAGTAHNVGITVAVHDERLGLVYGIGATIDDIDASFSVEGDHDRWGGACDMGEQGYEDVTDIDLGDSPTRAADAIAALLVDPDHNAIGVDVDCPAASSVLVLIDDADAIGESMIDAINFAELAVTP